MTGGIDIMRWSGIAMVGLIGLVVGVGGTLGIERSMHRNQAQRYYSSIYSSWRYQVEGAADALVGKPTVGHSIVAADYLFMASGMTQEAQNLAAQNSATGPAAGKFGTLSVVSLAVANVSTLVNPSLAKSWQDKIHHELAWILKHTPALWATTTNSQLNMIYAQTTRFQDAMEVLQSRSPVGDRAG